MRTGIDQRCSIGQEISYRTDGSILNAQISRYTLANYPLLTATARADGGDTTTTTGDASSGEAAAARVHAHGGADGCTVAAHVRGGADGCAAA